MTMPNTYSSNNLALPTSPPSNTKKATAVVTPSPSKRVTFKKDSEQWIINEKEMYFEFSLELLKSNLETY